MAVVTEEDLKTVIIPKLKQYFLDDKQGQLFHRALFDIFAQTKNPYAIALDLVRASPDYLQVKGTSMSASVMSEFERWHREHWKDDAKKRRLLTLDIRRRSYEICAKRHTHLLTKAAEIFDLVDIGELFLDDIKQKVDQGMHKEAVNCIIALKLQTFFKLSEVLIPCILLDKTAYVETYLDDYPDLQVELVKILDTVCLPEPDIIQFMQQNNINGLHTNKISVKPMAKLIARLLKKYNIPVDKAPYFTKTRSEGSLRYLLVRRYVERAINVENFSDMVYQAVETRPDLGPYLLDILCVTYNDKNEALKWAYRLNIPQGQWTPVLVEYAANHPALIKSRLHDENVENDPNAIDYLKLPIQIENVFMVDNKEELDSAMKELQIAPILGLDAEYMPSFGQPIEKVALLQIATKEKVFLFDIPTLLNKVGEPVLKESIENVLCNEETLKLGFHFGADLKVLALTLPTCADILAKMKNVVCIESLVGCLRRQNPQFMNNQTMEKLDGVKNEENKENKDAEDGQSLCNNLSSHLVLDDDNENGKLDEKAKISEQYSVIFENLPVKLHTGLSDVCKFFLGKPLDKSEQISNWGRRPLRFSQFVYAALDAICLLHVFEKIEKSAETMNLDFKRATSMAMVNSSAKVEARFELKKTKLSKNTCRAEILEVVKRVNDIREAKTAENAGNELQGKNVLEIKFIVDTMLQGLGKQLRRCGIDCKITENGTSTDFVIQTAVKDQRFALSSGSAFNSISSVLPANMCVNVPNGLNSKIQLEWFLHSQNINVTENDIFSRCIICNAKDFLIIPSAVFCTLWDSKMAPNDFLDPVPFDKEAALKRIDECLTQLDTDLPAYEPFFSEQNLTFVSNSLALSLLTGQLVRLDAPLDRQPVIVKIETVPGRALLNETSWFYLCATCGKVYWEGAHMARFEGSLGFEAHANGLWNFPAENVL